MLDAIRSWPLQIKNAFSVSLKISGSPLVIAGVGGSGIAGDIIVSAVDKLPVFVHKSYGLPGWINSNTLVFVVSYSGDSEEAISSYKQAKMKNCMLVVFASGGKLELMAMNDSVAFVRLPKGLSSRTALPSILFSMLSVLQYNKIVDVAQDVKTLFSVLQSNEWELKAKEIADWLKGIPVVYSGSLLAGAALRWQHSFNENAKMFCHYNTVPEMTHNEIQALSKDSYIILLRTKEEEGIKKRLDFVKNLAKGSRIPLVEIHINGSHLVSLCTVLYLGDLVGFFVAKAKNINPLDSSVIQELKKALR
ncbi:hypothetical protein HY486_00680 [Candidatus Woesearchaeota archaeon]|nr:hypothetical protein [Candidatus Woesearchaeota archaeon]